MQAGAEDNKRYFTKKKLQQQSFDCLRKHWIEWSDENCTVSTLQLIIVLLLNAILVFILLQHERL